MRIADVAGRAGAVGGVCLSETEGIEAAGVCTARWHTAASLTVVGVGAVVVHTTLRYRVGNRLTAAIVLGYGVRGTLAVDSAQGQSILNPALLVR